MNSGGLELVPLLYPISRESHRSTGICSNLEKISQSLLSFRLTNVKINILINEPGTVAHAFVPSTCEAEADEFL